MIVGPLAQLNGSHTRLDRKLARLVMRALHLPTRTRPLRPYHPTALCGDQFLQERLPNAGQNCLGLRLQFVEGWLPICGGSLLHDLLENRLYCR
jgi:hypothetical protein